MTTVTIPFADLKTLLDDRDRLNYLNSFTSFSYKAGVTQNVRMAIDLLRAKERLTEAECFCSDGGTISTLRTD